MTAFEKLAAIDMLQEADSLALAEDDEIDLTLDIWEKTIPTLGESLLKEVIDNGESIF